MTDAKHIRISDYNYELPDERIAKYPLDRRDSSRLLVYRSGEITEGRFSSLPDFLTGGGVSSPGLMVMNNTKVIQARLHFRKPTAREAQQQGALIEIFLLEPAEPADYEQMFQSRGRCSWYCLIGNLKKWKEGPLTTRFTTGGKDGPQTGYTITATRGPQHGTSHLVSFEWTEDGGLRPSGSGLPSFAEVIDTIGELPIPPYLNRKSEESDKNTYQTVYSKIKGSVAAPTAGLHFTPEVLSALDAKGIDREELTLHVGAGTFKPVKSEELGGHEMHTEYYAVRRETLQKLLRHDCRAIAVGTTSVRTLESLFYVGLRLQRDPSLTEEQLHIDQWEPYGDDAVDISAEQAIGNIISWLDRNGQSVLHSSTQIIIVPGYKYRIVKALVTNFHQPQSTLLLLVSAFVNGDWHRIYDYALGHGFRFLSYGDSSLLIP